MRETVITGESLTYEAIITKLIKLITRLFYC